MRIAVVSDTHGLLRPELLPLLAEPQLVPDVQRNGAPPPPPQPWDRIATSATANNTFKKLIPPPNSNLESRERKLASVIRS